MKSKIIKSILFSTIGVLPTGVVTPIVLSSCGKKIPVTGVKLDKDKLELVEEEIDQLKATVYPENATNKNVTWDSNNKNVVTVNQNGRVKAISEGNATITVTTKDGKKTATCVVSVIKKTIPVQSVKLNVRILMLGLGETDKLTATVLPSYATNKNVTWSSSDASVATVDENGNVEAISVGNATITVTTEDGNKTATCEAIVAEKVIHVDSVSLDKDKLELVEDDVAQLKATVLPEDATNKNVTWTSSDESIATVDENGNVKAISEGNATITVTTEDIGYEATCEVTVTKKVIHVDSVSLDKDKLELVEGGSAQLTATVLPENATNKKVIWISNNENVATVDENGNVKAVRKGYTDIYVITEDGEYTDTCEVTVNENVVPVTGISLDESSLDLIVGNVTQLTATIFPEDATNKNVTWSSSDESVVTVDENGNVKAISAGDAIITVTTEDGGYEVTCEVTVTEGNILVKGIVLTNLH